MYKVWHVKGDYFLLQMYNEAGDDKSYTVNTHRFGIFKASNATFQWVTGLPEATEINALSRSAYVEQGYAYMGVTTISAGSKPTIYVINPETAEAAPGLEITAEGLAAIGKLSN